ncbi:uncharacterized protein ARMOST_18085 [Armillaria ostoyae]|uniref:Uncharacterized protein n=1 Tax=Armillaria ostoyae TaxID=47428 RepID=A0A284S0T6_ARMOS|nr:uncharacterized protein ARMOST_18085 [Armillaria ostoyae]
MLVILYDFRLYRKLYGEPLDTDIFQQLWCRRRQQIDVVVDSLRAVAVIVPPPVAWVRFLSLYRCVNAMGTSQQWIFDSAPGTSKSSRLP